MTAYERKLQAMQRDSKLTKDQKIYNVIFTLENRSHDVATPFSIKALMLATYNLDVSDAEILHVMYGE